MTRQGILGAPPLSQEERKRLIDEPPTPWKEWALTEGLKPWIGVGLFTLDILSLITAWEGGTRLDQYATIPLIPLEIYLNFLLWSFLWRVPTSDELRTGTVKRSPIRPFAVGRWTYEYLPWKNGQREKLAEESGDYVNPREFA